MFVVISMLGAVLIAAAPLAAGQVGCAFDDCLCKWRQAGRPDVRSDSAWNSPSGGGKVCLGFLPPDYDVCTNLEQRTEAVNGECCDEPTEDCSSGRPATCNLGCARVLLPYFDDCSAALGKAARQFENVVALCNNAEDPDGPANVVVSRTTGADPTHGNPGTNQVFVEREDASGARQLTHCANGCVQPSWSPDGRRIVYAEQTQTGMQLRMVAPDGSGQQDLTTAPGYINMLPSWINSSHIVWARQRGGGSVHIGRCLAAGQRDDISASALYAMDVTASSAGAAERPMAPLFLPYAARFGFRPLLPIAITKTG